MPITPKVTLSLLDLLRLSEAPATTPASRGSPGEFDGLLTQIQEAEGALTTEPLRGLAVEPSAENALAAAFGERSSEPTLTTAISFAVSEVPLASSGTALSGEETATSERSALTPEEAEAVLRERDLLAALLSQTAQTVRENGSLPPTTEPTPSLTAVEVVPVVGGNAPLSEATAEETTTLGTPLVAAAAEKLPTEEVPPPLRVGKDYPVVLKGEETISTTALLRALQAKVLDEEPAPAASPTSRAGLLTESETPSPFPGALEPETGVFRTLGARTLMDDHPARTPLLTVSFLRSEGAPLVTTPSAGTIPVSSPLNPTGAPGRTLTNAESRVEGATRFSGSPLQRAQEVILRRAAQMAFAERNASAGNVGEGGTARSARLDAEPLVREMVRSLDRPVESLVRAERARTRARTGEPGERGPSAPEWNSPEHTSRVASQSATPPVTATAPSAAATSVAATPLAYAPMMEQIAQEARRNVRLGKREFRILLNPPHLGSVELEVVWDHDVVRVKITAASKESQKILEENVAELERALQRQGLGLDADLPWKASRRSSGEVDLRSDRWTTRWTTTWRPGLTVTR